MDVYRPYFFAKKQKKKKNSVRQGQEESMKEKWEKKVSQEQYGIKRIMRVDIGNRVVFSFRSW